MNVQSLNVRNFARNVNGISYYLFDNQGVKKDARGLKSIPNPLKNNDLKSRGFSTGRWITPFRQIYRSVRLIPEHLPTGENALYPLQSFAFSGQ